MKTEWQTKKLNEVCDFQNGFAFKSKLFKGKGFPVLRISNIQNDGISYNKLVYFDKKSYKENFDKYQVKKGDLVIAMSGATTGKLAVCDTDEIFYLNQRVGKFKPKKELLKDYLYYFLSTRIEENLKISTGSAQPNLSTEQIKNFKIPLPPLSEQHRIVKILDEVFEKTAKAKENAEKNIQNTKDLFDIYLQNIFTNKGKGWTIKKLSEVAEYFNGLTYSPKNVSDEGIIVLRSSNVQNNELDFSDIVRVNCTVKEKIIVQDGDILMCSRNGSKRLVGKTATIQGLTETMTFGTFMMIIRSTYNPYLAWFFKSSEFRKQISRGENTMINQITRYMLDDIIISFPSPKERNNIAAKIKALSAETKKLEAIYKQKLVDLEELKKSVLKKAFNGEL